jgi:hypothetical protein
MGNVVTGEALRLGAQGGLGQLVNTYVASQAAISVHVYDGTNAHLLSPVIAGVNPFLLDDFPETPDVYPDWFAGNSAAVGRRINFYNQNDFALAPDVWQINQFFKPDQSILEIFDQPKTYLYLDDPNAPPTQNGFGWIRGELGQPGDRAIPMPDGTYLYIAPLLLGSAADIRDRYEIMSFAAESRSIALGATAGNVHMTSSFDLRTIWPPDSAGHSAHKWHSAEFRSTNMKEKSYWTTLVGPIGFNIPIGP